MTERTYRITGRVQGVGFRWWTRSLAERLGIEGSVRNEADGSVIVRARGSADVMEQLESELAHGPPGAKVRQLDIVHVPFPPVEGFRIEH